VAAWQAARWQRRTADLNRALLDATADALDGVPVAGSSSAKQAAVDTAAAALDRVLAAGLADAETKSTGRKPLRGLPGAATAHQRPRPEIQKR
jgi:hypothetical protein